MEGEGLTGPVFGARDRWNGLGVFFDSFDNDGQVGVLLYTKHVIYIINVLIPRQCYRWISFLLNIIH